VGRISLKSSDYVEYAVTHVSIHPEYTPETYHADIALLKLERPVEGVEPATIIAAPTTEVLEKRLEGRDLSVMGFGRTVENGRKSKRLLVGTVQNVRSEVCNGTDSYAGNLTDAMFCARGDGVDACAGDSGGPLIRQTSENSFLVGVVSYGIGCASERYPGVYADVNALRPWIFQQVRQQDTWRAVP
jgi:secreted trypsin-like serine protease